MQPEVTELQTAGERLVKRPLRNEKRIGIMHYVTGQMAARQCDEDPDVYEVTFVNALGHACAILFIRDGDEWVPFPIFAWAGYNGFATQDRLPENFAITEGMLRRLEAARDA